MKGTNTRADKCTRYHFKLPARCRYRQDFKVPVPMPAPVELNVLMLGTIDTQGADAAAYKHIFPRLSVLIASEGTGKGFDTHM